MEFDPADADLFDPVPAPAGRPDVLDVAWTGGACDQATEVLIGRGARARGGRDDHAQRPAERHVMGLPRVVRLTLAAPIVPEAVTVTQ